MISLYKRMGKLIPSNTSIAIGIILAIIPATAQQQNTRTPFKNKNNILLGQSLPLSGPSAQIGQKYRAGANAWFDEVNREGGIKGRKIELISLDDQYEPDMTVTNTKTLLAKPNLLALFGYVGTPTTKESTPLN